MRRSVGTRGPISVRAIYAVATAVSSAADSDTGRNALPGNAALTAKQIEPDPQADAYWSRVSAGSGYGLTTVQKAVQVLVARGWLVLVRAGKNYLTREDRTEMWFAGSAARQRRNVWACTIPSHARRARVLRPTQSAEVRLAEPSSVDNSVVPDMTAQSGCDLPPTRRVRGLSLVKEYKNFKPEQASRTGATRRAPTDTAQPKRTYRADQRVVKLAKDLKARIPWLRHVPHSRIMPSLHRFAIADWTARELQDELDRLLEQRGWTVPGMSVQRSEDRPGLLQRISAGSAMRSPWGYFAFLLRHLEPSDLIAEKLFVAERAAAADYQRKLIYGTPCVHGQPAGNVPSPARGVLACPFCRRDRATG